MRPPIELYVSILPHSGPFSNKYSPKRQVSLFTHPPHTAPQELHEVIGYVCLSGNEVTKVMTLVLIFYSTHSYTLPKISSVNADLVTFVTSVPATAKNPAFPIAKTPRIREELLQVYRPAMFYFDHIDHDNFVGQFAQDSVFADSVPPVAG